MESINLTISTFDEGNWTGNSTLTEREVFKKSTILPINCKENKPKGLKVTKEDQRLIGLMVNELDG